MIGQAAGHIHIPYEFTIFNGKTQHKKWPMGIRSPFVVFFEAPSCYSARGVRGEGCAGWRMLEGLGQKIFKSSPMKFSDVSTFGFEKIAWGKLRWKALWLGLGFPKKNRQAMGLGTWRRSPPRRCPATLCGLKSAGWWLKMISWGQSLKIQSDLSCKIELIQWLQYITKKQMSKTVTKRWSNTDCDLIWFKQDRAINHCVWTSCTATSPLGWIISFPGTQLWQLTSNWSINSWNSPTLLPPYRKKTATLSPLAKEKQTPGAVWEMQIFRPSFHHSPICTVDLRVFSPKIIISNFELHFHS
jgi:hypothetical protein